MDIKESELKNGLLTSLPRINRLTFFFPLVGLMNLFVYVLKYPFASSVARDLFLMDVVVGHFGYLHFISASEFVFPFPREIASYAGRLVRNAAREKAAPRGGEDNTHPQKLKGSITHIDYRRNMKGKDVLSHPTVALSSEVSGVICPEEPRVECFI